MSSRIVSEVELVTFAAAPECSEMFSVIEVRIPFDSSPDSSREWKSEYGSISKGLSHLPWTCCLLASEDVFSAEVAFAFLHAGFLSAGSLMSVLQA